MKIALETAPKETPIVDVTIIYHGQPNFWHCLGGGTREIDIIIRTFKSSDVNQIRDWLHQRWSEKDGFFDPHT